MAEPRIFTSPDELKAAVGEQLGHTDWLEVDQKRIDLFAEATGDHQWIHVDPEKAAAGPFGTTIAHGFLTLSLLVKLGATIPVRAERFDGVVMGVNYGFVKIRFIAPVKVNSRIRATSVITAVDLKDPNTLHYTRTMTVEIEGESKPALIAEWITRLVYA